MNARARAPGDFASHTGFHEPAPVKVEEPTVSQEEQQIDGDSQLVCNANKTAKPTKSKSRKRVNTAEKRASHNAVERQRREMLNGRFLVGLWLRFSKSSAGF
jgi:hypothetical protein